MDALDISKPRLDELNAEQAEELIHRLARAEVKEKGGKLSDLHRSGPPTVQDGGKDLRFSCTAEDFKPDYLQSAEAVIQIKKSELKPSSIKNEMCPNGKLRELFADLSKKSGSYIIANLQDLGPLKIEKFEKEMNETLKKNFKETCNIKTFCYGLSELHQWLMDHPSVQIWVREKLNMPLQGWKSYQRWCDTPDQQKGEYIQAKGVSFKFPGDKTNYSNSEAIPRIREMLSKNANSIRIIGLAGIGKTRLLQALFDEKIKQCEIDSNSVIYADMEEDPFPNATTMFDFLNNENKSVYLILDNCSPTVHSQLANKLKHAGKNLKLITVEYDITDDNPEGTDVIQMFTDEKLDLSVEVLKVHYPNLNPENAKKIADFSGGNSRLALLIAEKVDEDRTVAYFSAEEFFNKLFYQRGNDKSLRKYAEALSLVYSYSIDLKNPIHNDLKSLGSLVGADSKELYRANSELKSKQLVGKIGNWSAVLPHAMANRLAAYALKNIPHESIYRVFSQNENQHLLVSLCHRLGLMHNVLEANEFVSKAFKSGGIFCNLDYRKENDVKILDYLAPIAMDQVFDKIQEFTNDPYFPIFMKGDDPNYFNINYVVCVLCSIASHSEQYFEKCLNLLTKIAKMERHPNRINYIPSQITQFYVPYRPANLAELDSREKFLRELITSEDTFVRGVGAKLLSMALRNYTVYGRPTIDFGAHPQERDDEINVPEQEMWLKRFILVAVELETEMEDISEEIRKMFAENFGFLWKIEALRDELAWVAETFNRKRYWIRGICQINMLIYIVIRNQLRDYKRYGLKELLKLSERLIGNDLLLSCRCILMNPFHSIFPYYNLNKLIGAIEGDFQRDVCDFVRTLARNFSQSIEDLKGIDAEIFQPINEPNFIKINFGKGLAEGSIDRKQTWFQLVSMLGELDLKNFDPRVLIGFLNYLFENDHELSEELLNFSADHEKLKTKLVFLHYGIPLKSSDLTRCLNVLKSMDDNFDMYSLFFTSEFCRNLPFEDLVNLGNVLMNKNGGERTLIYALAERIKVQESNADLMGPQLRGLALEALIKWFNDTSIISINPEIGRFAKKLVRHCLLHDGNMDNKLTLLNNIIDWVGQFNPKVASLIQDFSQYLPREFLNCIYCDDEDTKAIRIRFMRRESLFYSVELFWNADPKILIDWCGKSKGKQVWEDIAISMLCLEVKDVVNNLITYEMTKTAVEFLEACPEPEMVLEKYGECIFRVRHEAEDEIRNIAKKIDAFRFLTKHDNSRIAKSAEKIIESSEKSIKENIECQKKFRLESEELFKDSFNFFE